ncbi:MAG: 4-diphosphocytidyl-2C-methyl-D-erythritol kinase [Gemmatimonadetes bacterium]|nr:4-diphosphocytidyl-2C-methyl-D-erythritol kinase [Gemmatimonadota bacterium]
MIAGLLLAAGRSRRFGADKLAAKLDGKAVIRWSAESLTSLDAVYVVIPPGADMLTQALSRLDVNFVINLGRDEGMASSIRAGLAALPRDADAVVIALADQPRIPSTVVHEICERWRKGDVAAVAPVYSDGRGHPVLFGRECFEALLSVRGDVGARSVLDTLDERLALIEVVGPTPADVDTPDILQALQRR